MRKTIKRASITDHGAGHQMNLSPEPALAMEVVAAIAIACGILLIFTL